MTKRALIALLAAVALALPAAALADQGNHGNQGDHGKGHHGKGHKGPDHKGQDHKGGNGKSKKCDKPRRVAFTLHGTFASFDSGTGQVTVDVVRANRHARRFLNGATTFTFATTGDNAPKKVGFVGVTDSTAPTGVGFEDALTTDRVHVKGKLALAKHGCPATDPVLTLKKVKVIRPGSKNGS